MDANGISRRGALVIGFLSAAVGAGAAVAWSRSEAEQLRRELVSLSHRIGRAETTANGQSPIKVLRVERLEVVAPDGSPRGEIQGNASSATLRLRCERGDLRLQAQSDYASLSLDASSEKGSAARVLLYTSQNVSSVSVLAHSDVPDSGADVTLTSLGMGRGQSELSIDSRIPWSEEGRKARLAENMARLKSGRGVRSPRARIETSPLDDDCALTLADAEGRPRLSAVVGASETPRFTLLDAEGRVRLALGRSALKGAIGEFETPEDTIVSFGEDGMVKWREPR